MTPEKRRDASFKFQLVFYRRNLNRNGGAEIRLTLRQTSASSTSQLNDCGRLFFNRLCKGANGYKSNEQHRRVRSHCALFFADSPRAEDSHSRSSSCHSFTSWIQGRFVGQKRTVVCRFSRFLTSKS